MQTPKKFSSFSDQVSWISDEKGIKIKDREYAEEMLRQIGYFPLMCIFRKNCASVPEERSAIPLQTEQSSAG